MQKEKYEELEELMETKNGKRRWTKYAEENIFEKDLEGTIRFVTEYPGMILLFSHYFTGANPVVVHAAIKALLESADTDPIDDYFAEVKMTLEEIPYDVLKEHYFLIYQYAQKNGNLLECVPLKLQEEYLQIPMEAVRNDPRAVKYASGAALRSYPDIAIFAVKADPSLIEELPSDVASSVLNLIKKKYA